MGPWPISKPRQRRGPDSPIRPQPQHSVAMAPRRSVGAVLSRPRRPGHPREERSMVGLHAGLYLRRAQRLPPGAHRQGHGYPRGVQPAASPVHVAARTLRMSWGVLTLKVRLGFPLGSSRVRAGLHSGSRRMSFGGWPSSSAPGTRTHSGQRRTLRYRWGSVPRSISSSQGSATQPDHHARILLGGVQTRASTGRATRGRSRRP